MYDDVDLISFTGSTRAGRRINEVASQTIKRVRTELGGKAAAGLLTQGVLGVPPDPLGAPPRTP